MRIALIDLAALAYFFAPAWLANMAPPFTRFWRGWNRPISERWLGSHKTVIGALLGVVVAVLTTAAQAWADVPFSRVDYSGWPWLGAGFGIGAMGGDMLKSFAKRRLGIPPGARWVPFDQIDFAVGALILVGPGARLDATEVVLLLIMTFIGDIAVNRFAFRLGIKSDPW